MAVVVRPRAVLDTSALWGRGPRGELVRALDVGRFVGLWSEWIIGELYYGLAWDWAANRGADDTQRRAMARSARAMLRLLIPRMQVVSLRDAAIEPWPTLRDREDEPVWGDGGPGSCHPCRFDEHAGLPAECGGSRRTTSLHVGWDRVP